MKCINKIKCRLEFHDYIIENISEFTNNYTCKNCGYSFGITTVYFPEIPILICKSDNE